MYVTTNDILKLHGKYVPNAERNELIAIWRSLRRLPSMKTKFRKCKERRQNPRYILEIQTIKRLDDFRTYAVSRNWKHGYVPVLENPELIPDTELEFRYDNLWEKNAFRSERILTPVHRPAGTVPEYLWVTDYDVRFISLQALHRRKELPQNLPNYSLQRLRQYRKNSSRHQQGTMIYGENKSLRQWAQDPRCHVSLATLTKRIKAGITPEVALKK